MYKFSVSSEILDRIQKGTFKNFLPKIPESYRVSKVEKDYKNAKLVIFISSSMPEETIRNFIKSTQDIYDYVYFVIRGFVNGIKKFKPTYDWTIKILCSDNPPGSPECLNATIDINPNLFNQFNIQKVPAIMVIEKGNLDSCSVCNGNKNKIPDVFISYGDANIKYHLAKMEEAGSKTAHWLISKFKNQYYDIQ